MWRSWHPLGAQSPEADGDDFVVTCGVASCGTPIPIFRGQRGTAFEVARVMSENKGLEKSICPYECQPTLSSHELSALDTTSLRALGSFAGVSVPGIGEVNGFSSFTRVGIVGDTPVGANEMFYSVPRTKCADLAAERYITGAMLVIWLRVSYSGSTALGDCGFLHVARTRQDLTLWQAFHTSARRHTTLSHFVELADTQRVARVPDDTTQCGALTSNVWHK